jgi:hypothetical protein
MLDYAVSEALKKQKKKSNKALWVLVGFLVLIGIMVASSSGQAPNPAPSTQVAEEALEASYNIGENVTFLNDCNPTKNNPLLIKGAKLVSIQRDGEMVTGAYVVDSTCKSKDPTHEYQYQDNDGVFGSIRMKESAVLKAINKGSLSVPKPLSEDEAWVMCKRVAIDKYTRQSMEKVDVSMFSNVYRTQADGSSTLNSGIKIGQVEDTMICEIDSAHRIKSITLMSD